MVRVSEKDQAVPIEFAGIFTPRPPSGPIRDEAALALDAIRHRELGTALQIQEIRTIKNTSDRIEKLFQDRGLKLPAIYSLHTKGIGLPFKLDESNEYQNGSLENLPPETFVKIGKFGEGPFAQIPETDIFGHAGDISIAKIDENNNYMAWEGRDHPYTETRSVEGNMISVRTLRTIKELMRRQRERGENPILITSYLSGVVEGHPLKPKDIGIIFDDAELGPSTQPGTGPHDIFDKWIGERFQPKAERVTSMQLARLFYKKAQEFHVPVGTVAIMGTPRATEFESFLETGLGASAFEMAKKLGLDQLVRELYPRYRIPERWVKAALARLVNSGLGKRLEQTLATDNHRNSKLSPIFNQRISSPSLVFGMGNTSELATLRELFYGEDSFPILAITLITDSVGKEGSGKVDHAKVVNEAMKTEPRNAVLIRNLIKGIVNGEANIPKPSRKDGFSLKSRLRKYSEVSLLDEEIPIVSKDPSFQTLGDIIEYYKALLHFESKYTKKLEDSELQDDVSTRKEAVEMYRMIVKDLAVGDGVKAYDFFLNQAERFLRLAEKTGISIEEQKRLLNYAENLSQAAQIVAREKGIFTSST